MIKSHIKSFIILKMLSISLCFSNIINVDPPNWWTHFGDRKLELMVYGDNIGLSRNVSIFNSKKETETQILIKRIKQTDNKNYLFIKNYISKP